MGEKKDVVKCNSCSKMHLYSTSHDCVACMADICNDCEDKYESCSKECLIWVKLFSDKQTGRCDWKKLYAFLY